MGSWPGGLSALTLFVEDLVAARDFYDRAFGLPVHFEDDVSAVFDFGGTLVNLLAVEAAHELLTPAVPGGADAGVRAQLTLEVADVDARAAELRDRGIDLLNGPMDRPWGIRTASFRDPAGHVWEIAGPPRGQ
jgi:catechol 2,3-dioxygenase-like lactoylglutathione lyase family enzyme